MGYEWMYNNFFYGSKQVSVFTDLEVVNWGG